MNKAKGLFMMVVLVLMLLVMGVPVMAQEADATDEAPVVVVVDNGNGVADVVDEAPPTLEERATVTLRDAVIAILLVAGGIVTAVTGALGTIVLILSRTMAKVVGIALERVYASVPTYYQPVVADLLDRATVDAVARAKETPTPFEMDDEFFVTLRGIVEQVLVAHLGEVARVRGAGVTAVNPNPSDAVG